MAHGFSCGRSLAGALALAALPLVAQAQVRAGGEFRVNAFTTGYQLKPGVAGTPAGGFVVVWSSENQDGSAYGAFGQRFDGRGLAAGAEFRANTYTLGNQSIPGGAALGVGRNGDFVVAWTGYYAQDGSGAGVFAQRYDRTGARRGAEFQVNAYTTDFQSAYAVALDRQGRFVVAWASPQDGSSNAAVARRYDATGVPAGGEFLLSTATLGAQFMPDVAVAADGSFVAAFVSERAGHFAVDARRFDAGGNGLGAEFQVNGYTGADQYTPDVQVAPDGSFLVVWDGADATGRGILARRFDAGGAPLGAEAHLTSPAVVSFLPKAAFDESGRYVITWSQFTPTGSGLQAQRFEEDGSPREAAFQVESVTTRLQYYSSVASDAVGNFVVTWDDYGLDGSGDTVAAQRFGGLQPAALAVGDGAAGNGVLEVGDTFTLATAWRNVNGAAQAFAGQSSGGAAPPGLTLTLSPGATYGTVANGAVGACAPTCFAGTLTGTRPPGHQDAAFDEDITPAAQGQEKRWLLHVGESFTDVPRGSGFYRFVETLLHHGVTGGCGGSSYCPGLSTTREQMAVFVLVAREGAGYVPPACTTPVFNDVPAGSSFCRYVEELFRRGVVSGCGGGSYCPADPVTREQMAVFVLRTLDPALNPPACTTPVFGDVPASSPFCRWIEELARRGVVAGCGGGNYCPTGPVTREQMGVFIGATFGLTLYGP